MLRSDRFLSGVTRDRLGVLDGVRGIAVLLVLWFHVWEISWLHAPWPWLQFVPETGFVGVTLFFFISGFVIAYPFVQAKAAGASSPSWGHFAYRRFIKIVPSYVLSLAVVIAAGYATFRSPLGALWQIGTHLLFVHTWFPSTYGTINGVLWTLGVEVQFYVLFPALWWCFSRRPWLTAAVMAAIAFAFRVFSVRYFFHSHLFSAIENLPSYLDIFAAGMIGAHLYVALRERRAGDPRAAAAWTAVSLAGAVALIELLRNLWAFRFTDQWFLVWQVDNRLWIALAILAIATGGLLGSRLWQRALANRVLIFFAAISYNLYLYHQFVARELLRLHIPPYVTAIAHDDPHWQITFTVIASLASIAVATLITYLFERPLLRMPASRLRNIVSRLVAQRALPPM